MAKEFPANPNFHPEGLTETQEKLADLLFTTKIEAKVRRRRQLPDESYELYEVVRDTSPVDFAQEDEFALKLHERQPDAPLSPIYISLRNLPPKLLEQIGKVLAEIPSEKKPDICAGIPNAGIPLAKEYSKFSGIPMVNIFDKEETETGRRIVAGKEQTRGRKIKVRLIDDLVTQADTKLEAIRTAESLGYEVVDVFVLVDREQGGKEQLAKAGYKLESAFTLTQLLDYYLRTERITQEKYHEVKNYLAAA